MKKSVSALFIAVFFLVTALTVPARAGTAENTLVLQDLIDEALRNNHEVWKAESAWRASVYRIEQAESLPDPQFKIGYQNEGWRRYTYGDMLGAQWLYSLSQKFPFPGKRSLMGETAARGAEGAEAAFRAVRLDTIARVKELYYDLFLAYRDIDLVQGKMDLFGQVEEAALARYGAGTAPQQEVLMAQSEKYMLTEKEAMLRQKATSAELMLLSVLGTLSASPLGRPAEPVATAFPYALDELLDAAAERSPEIRARFKMREAAEANLHLKAKDYYPDVTLAANVAERSGPFEDMWSVTATFNIPLYFDTKRSAEDEARLRYQEAIHHVAGIKVMVSSGVRDAYSMMKTAETLMGLYREGLIPKITQDFESALAAYRSGRVDATTVIGRLKTLLDYETLYWDQFVAREKAIARLEAMTAISELAVNNENEN